MKIVIASSNKHKIAEIAARCADIPGILFVPVHDIIRLGEIEENGISFEENALIKARAVRDATNLPSLADDSGLVIDSLGGEPGIYSARYGGLSSDAERNTFVLSRMESVADYLRTARFACVLALAFPDGREYVVRGECEGSILRHSRGVGGFG
ncbi:MAG TPA: non-canonical purine NTP pyrophosphatase, partial [Spirochaetota bacterium]